MGVSITATSNKLNSEQFSSFLKSNLSPFQIGHNNIKVTRALIVDKVYYKVKKLAVKLTYKIRPIPLQGNYLFETKNDFYAK